MHELGPFSNTVGAAAFWLFLAAAAVAGNLIPHLKERELQRTIRQIADKGEGMDPAVLEALLKRTKPSRTESLRQLQLGGTVLSAAAFGLCLIGFAVGAQAGKTIYPIFGASGLALLIGLALLFHARTGLAQIKREGGEN